MSVVRLVPRHQPRGWQKDEVVDRLGDADVAALYHALNIGRLKSGGPDNYKAFVPWRDNKVDEAMTINRHTGVWSDKATGDGGSIFDAVIRQGKASDFPEAIEWVVKLLGWQRPDETPLAGRVTLQVTDYDYLDESGALLYRSRREDYVTADGEVKKKFIQGRPLGTEFVWSLPSDMPRVLFNLPELMSPANADRAVYFVEGEKCAEAAADLGVLATCIVGGSNAWRPEYVRQLAGRDVVILPDQDKPGQKFAALVADALLGSAASVKVVELPALGPVVEKGGRDVADWIKEGHTLEELVGVVGATPLYVTAPRETLFTSLRDLYRNPPVAPPQMIANIWEPASFGLILAQPKSFKGFFVVDMMCSLASGTPFLGWPEFAIDRPYKVVYWAEEGTLVDIFRRILRWADARGVAEGDWIDNIQIVFGKGLRLRDPEGIAALREDIARYQPDIVFCDTLARVSAGLDENSGQDMSQIIDALDSIKNEFHCATVYVHHGSKAAGGARGHSSLLAAADCIARLERKSHDSNEVKIDIELKSGHDSGTFHAELRDVNRDGALFHMGQRVRAMSARVTADDVLAYVHRHAGATVLESQIKRDLRINADDYGDIVTELKRMGKVVVTQREAEGSGRRAYQLTAVNRIGEDDDDE